MASVVSTCAGLAEQRGEHSRHLVMFSVGLLAPLERNRRPFPPIVVTPLAGAAQHSSAPTSAGQHRQSTSERAFVANIKSQIKRIITNKKSQERNKAVKSQLKTAVRSARTAVAAGDKEQAVIAHQLAHKRLDKAVSKGVIHKNQAANRKSALAKQVASL